MKKNSYGKCGAGLGEIASWSRLRKDVNYLCGECNYKRLLSKQEKPETPNVL